MDLHLAAPAAAVLHLNLPAVLPALLPALLTVGTGLGAALYATPGVSSRPTPAVARQGGDGGGRGQRGGAPATAAAGGAVALPAGDWPLLHQDGVGGGLQHQHRLHRLKHIGEVSVLDM